MLGCFQKNASYTSNTTLSGTNQSSSHHADTLKYAFTDGLEYNKCKLVSNFGAALMTKENTGRPNHDY